MVVYVNTCIPQYLNARVKPEAPRGHLSSTHDSAQGVGILVWGMNFTGLLERPLNPFRVLLSEWFQFELMFLFLMSH
jgi:hypothetical protein